MTLNLYLAALKNGLRFLIGKIEILFYESFTMQKVKATLLSEF